MGTANERAQRVILAKAHELEGMTCQGPECDLPARVHFLCNSHYYQKRRGNPLTPRRKYNKKIDD